MAFQDLEAFSALVSAPEQVFWRHIDTKATHKESMELMQPIFVKLGVSPIGGLGPREVFYFLLSSGKEVISVFTFYLCCRGSARRYHIKVDHKLTSINHGPKQNVYHSLTVR